MANRHDRRKQAKRRRTKLGKLKLRCMGCDRVGQPMTAEHVFLQWLIERANGRAEPIRWLNDKHIDPMSATLPLCVTCNNDWGAQLEAPVSAIFEDLEAGQGITK